ncbi:MAG: (Fe-S)-binding protein [Bowdeniella nasicola]|nr:(Fe-S)-binding protein [Bowdeniella nasicola]
MRTALLAIALLATIIGVAIFARGLWRIITTVRAGHPTEVDRIHPVGKRTWLTIKALLGHGRFQHRPIIRVAHWLVMVSFPILFFTLVAGYGQLLSPAFALPVIGHFLPYEWAVEAIAWACLLAIIILMAVRIANWPRTVDQVGAQPATPLTKRSSRFFASVHWHAIFVEVIIVVVAASVIILRAGEAAWGAITGASWATAMHFPLTWWLATIMQPLGKASLAALIMWVALVKILTSVAWFIVVGCQPTMGVAWHRFLAIVNVYTRHHLDGTAALGPLSPMMAGGKPFTLAAMDDLDEDVSLGVGSAADFTWKALLDFATCTECGRCQDLCPAWNTGKPLSPKTLITTLRDHTAAVLPPEETHADVDVFSAASLLMPDVVSEDVLWSCTTCGACVDQCPVDIEHIDHVMGLRRYQVLMESAFPREFAGMFRSLESKGNPWGQASRKRMEWAKELPFSVLEAGIDIESLTEVEYLLWVGCAGSFDNRAKKTTQALAELLHIAGVSFAVLGEGESCTGDPARRAGNEILFQMLAEQNIEVLNDLDATKIVVSCAHCFNTIGREYPEFGGHYEVVHHTQLLNRLVREGKLRLAPPPAGTVTYHDPCYLGRHNQVYTPPRELLDAMGLDVKEMPRNRERAMCCGAGGAHAWMEDKLGSQINRVRAAEASATGAQTVATACPFCTQMLADGSAANNDDVQVRDVATLMLEAARRAEDQD